jgi:hypothetical protein
MERFLLPMLMRPKNICSDIAEYLRQLDSQKQWNRIVGSLRAIQSDTHSDLENLSTRGGALCLRAE